MRIWSIIIGLSGFGAVALAAIGAHALSDGAAQALVEKASFYQLIHTVALLAIIARAGKIASVMRACWGMGIALFCGSLYLKAFGIITHATLAPFGGTLFMAGWLSLFVAGLSVRENGGSGRS